MPQYDARRVKTCCTRELKGGLRRFAFLSLQLGVLTACWCSCCSACCSSVSWQSISPEEPTFWVAALETTTLRPPGRTLTPLHLLRRGSGQLSGRTGTCGLVQHRPASWQRPPLRELCQPLHLHPAAAALRRPQLHERGAHSAQVRARIDLPSPVDRSTCSPPLHILEL